MKYHYIIIGGGLAGASAVGGIREHDTTNSIALVGKEKYLPYHRPPLTKSLWTGKKTVDDIFYQNESYYTGQGVTLKLGIEVVGLDVPTKTITTAAGESFSFEKLLIATGGEPHKLNPTGPNENGLFYYRQLDHYLALAPLCHEGARAIIIGGGFIGTEMAAALSMKNVKVTMVFPENRPCFTIFPEELGQYVLSGFQKRGIEIVTRDKPAAVQKMRNKYRIQCESGKWLEGEFVIAGLGIAPSEGLAARAGVEVGKGIRVNSFLQTSHPDVFSAGDVAAFPQAWSGVQARLEHWDNAVNQGKTAGENMAGARKAYGYMPYFFSDLFDLGYEAVGQVDSRLATFCDWQEEFKKGVIYYLRDDRVKGALLCNIWEKVETARAMIRSDARVSPESLRGAIK
jgi:3-phenylpropionate/trans-cinnamate dioxygenase ferredoxin reductase component